MSKIPVRFKRVAAAFDEAAAARLPLSESSGSEHSPPAESSAFLSDLVNSFLESETKDSVVGDEEATGDKMGSRNNYNSDCNEDLERLVAAFDQEYDPARENIYAAVEEALHEAGDWWSADYKRRLMARLRCRGFDAGLCKSKWEKTNNCLAGNHEYVDVISKGNRYIIEVSLAKEFEIARPTCSYSKLLDHFPRIFVGKQDELKQIVKLMCKSMKKSMKCLEMKVPPWRRGVYMNAKWFSYYKRTTNEVAAQKSGCVEEGFKRNRSVGFVTMPNVSYSCRSERVDVKGGVKIGNLTAALQ